MNSRTTEPCLALQRSTPTTCLVTRLAARWEGVSADLRILVFGRSELHIKPGCGVAAEQRRNTRQTSADSGDTDSLRTVCDPRSRAGCAAIPR
jgi:hypothetical protein